MATKANVAIYPIDARGWIASPPDGGEGVGASRGTGRYSGSPPSKLTNNVVSAKLEHRDG